VWSSVWLHSCQVLGTPYVCVCTVFLGFELTDRVG